MLKVRRIFKYRYLILALCCLMGFFAQILLGSLTVSAYKTVIMLLGLGGAFLGCYLLFGNEKLDERQLIFLIFAAGFIFRLIYIRETDWAIRQHDVYGTDGHMDYILRLYQGKGLPESGVWQYYQPPAWHFICAVWLRIQTFFGVSMEIAKENLQLLSLYCSGAIMLISHKLLKMLKINGFPLVLCCVIIAFHPTLIILSGSINNDVLSLTMALASAVLALKWYKNPKISTIIGIAFCIGLSMAVKLSGGLVAVAIAVLFITVFIKNFRNKWQNLLCQFSVFGVICVPMALWWPVRSAILYNVPLTYVPSLSETSNQFIGFRGAFERLFDFSSLFEKGVYPARVLERFDFEYFEYNIPLGALKSSVFGEYYMGKGTPLEIFGNILFYSALVLATVALASMIYFVIKAVKEKKDLAFKLYPAIIWVTSLVFYVKFCFDFPHFCTMDFRYIAITLIMGVLYVGLMLSKIQSQNTIFSKIMLYITLSSAVLMSASSCTLYLTIA